jgi:hypothetical protein
VGEQVVVLAVERVALLEEVYGYVINLNRALIEP